ncbi:B3 domain-containing transcription factor VRN1 isoform X2 [Jatropha curcas]|uniref:B3 domain-containing transcription factor VRN1 isoform X2 n=1 Tax=Jatropha curcas TaxID=180498 RepID=UPI001895D37C|nr:B3 domain-containing transcription factor VRN1 isoform X2 [Jatropha curcas]
MDKREHFFKIVHDNAIREGKLGIPKKFIRKYGNDLTSPAILKVPCGAVWKVELLKGDDEVWFEKGWGEFAKYYSLEYGYLLVFQYMGQSNFQVVILDKSAVEIQYPYDRVCAAEPKHDWDFQEAKAQANEENISVEALDDQSLKKIRIDSTSKTPNISLSGNLPTCTSAHGHGDLKQDQQAKRRSCSSTSSALEAVNNFVSENPFFKAVVCRLASVGVMFKVSKSV